MPFIKEAVTYDKMRSQERFVEINFPLVVWTSPQILMHAIYIIR